MPSKKCKKCGKKAKVIWFTGYCSSKCKLPSKGIPVDWRASVPEECQAILPALQKGRPGNYSLPSPVQTAVYRTELSLGIGVPSRMPPFHSDIFIRSQV